MSNCVLLHQLAVERCQHNLAQLSALCFLNTNHFLEEEEDEPCDCEAYQESVRLLIEDLNRDLLLIRKTAESGEVYKLKAMLTEKVGGGQDKKLAVKS